MLLRCILAATLLMLACAAASAQRIGQTRDAIVAEHGKAAEENHSKGTAVYRRAGLKIDISYKGDAASRLVVTALDTLNDQGIAAILAAHGSSGTWKELQISGSSRIWQASDLASASCDRVKPRSVTFNAGFRRQAAAGAPAALPLTTHVPRFTLPPVVWTGKPAPSAPTTISRGQVTKSTAQSPQVWPGTRSTPGTAGQRAAEDAIATTLGGLVAAIFTVTFVVLIPGVVLVVVLKLLLPLLVKRWIESLFRPKLAPLSAAPPAPIATRYAPASLAAQTPPPLPPASLDNIGWENFELLTGEIFRRKGYEVEITSGTGADGGKDLVLHKNGELVLVQCKNLARENRVTATQMRDFFGLLTAERAARGYFVTTGYFSADAQKFAAAKPIECFERAGVERLIEEVSKPGENLCDVNSWIDSFATGAHIVDPLCPRCDQPMKLRRGALRRAFWGCSVFPRCRGKRDGRETLLRARQWQGSYSRGATPNQQPEDCYT